MRHLLTICRGYAVEIALAAAVYALLVLSVGSTDLAEFIEATWAAWTTICGVVFAAAITMLVIVLQMLTSEFGGYLVSRSADGTFRKAFGFAIAVSFLAMVALVLAGTVKSVPISHIAGMLSLLTGINLYTMIVNAMNLQRMSALFERIKRREEQRVQTEPLPGKDADVH